jgi:hypothetical protein
MEGVVAKRRYLERGGGGVGIQHHPLFTTQYYHHNVLPNFPHYILHTPASAVDNSQFHSQHSSQFQAHSLPQAQPYEANGPRRHLVTTAPHYYSSAPAAPTQTTTTYLPYPQLHIMSDEDIARLQELSSGWEPEPEVSKL